MLQIGSWNYTITSSGPSEVMVTVLSGRRFANTQPIIAKARWGQIQVNGSQQQDKQTVYVTVSQGLLLLMLKYRQSMSQSQKVYYC